MAKERTRVRAKAGPPKGERKPKGEPKGERKGATQQEAPPLTRQEKFCRLIALEHQTPYEAYSNAFDYEGDIRRAQIAANGLLELQEISDRIAELAPLETEMTLGEDMITLGEHLRELLQLERLATGLGQMGPAITAAIHRGKASGLYVERSITANVTLEDLIAGSRADGSIGLPPQSQRVGVIDSSARSSNGGKSGPKLVKGGPSKKERTG